MSLSVGATERAAERLRRLLAQSEPEAVVGSAACGADLMVLEIALALQAQRGHPRIEVVLPTPFDVFREDSVAPGWRGRFDGVLARVRETGTVHQLGMAPATEAYERANDLILERAAGLAADLEARFLVLAIAEQGGGSAVEQMVRAAAVRGARELRIDPRDLSGNKGCFIVMPYGRKLDPASRTEIDCDRTYGRLLVPALEHAQLRYRRADESIDPGVVLQPMIDDIAHADLVIADLATGNFNVGWELGLRHLFTPGRTLLVKPSGGHPAPFDVQALRTVQYDAGALDDAAVLDAWARLEPYLAVGADGGWVSPSENDSPVAATMRLTFAQVALPGGGEDDPVERLVADLIARLARARELADPQVALSVVTAASGVPPERRLPLLESAGALLLRLGRFDEARRPLQEVVDADPQVELPSAHLLFAQALYRPDDATADDLLHAERVLDAVDRRRVPEVHALLGAIAKRRAVVVTGPARVAELVRAFEDYSTELKRDLNGYYPAVNLVSLGVVLGLVHGDAERLERGKRVLPLAIVSAETALERDPTDFWPIVSLAELALMRAVLEPSDTTEARAEAAYARASAARPLAGDRDSAADQLTRLLELGLPARPIERARAAFSPRHR
jgi:tetratricopeptide (TPR) repeat protein